jgi:pentapeptide repeat protein
VATCIALRAPWTILAAKARPSWKQCSNCFVDVARPTWWCCSEQCENGHEWGPGRVLLSSPGVTARRVSFGGAEFSGGLSGVGAEFSRGVYFTDARFSGGQVDFGSADFSGVQVSFSSARFSGGTVDFQDPRQWSKPPAFDWADAGPPPAGVMLPASADAAPQHEPGSEAPRQP